MYVVQLLRNEMVVADQREMCAPSAMLNTCISTSSILQQFCVIKHEYRVLHSTASLVAADQFAYAELYRKHGVQLGI